MVQLVADVRHLGPVDDLPVARRARVDVDDRDEVRAIDAGALIQRGDIDELLRGLLAREFRGGVAGAVVLVVGVIVSADRRTPLV